MPSCKVLPKMGPAPGWWAKGRPTRCEGGAGLPPGQPQQQQQAGSGGQEVRGDERGRQVAGVHVRRGPEQQGGCHQVEGQAGNRLQGVFAAEAWVAACGKARRCRRRG